MTIKMCWAAGSDDPLQRALDNCNKRGAGACQLYAVDEDLVWFAQDEWRQK
jgi:hypothetical protein